jgi:mono/diheme cytochrome c family protein
MMKHHTCVCTPRTAVFAVLRASAALAAMLVFGFGAAAAASLEIVHGTQTRQYGSAELVSHPALREIEIPADVAYNKPMRFRAVPLAALIGEPDRSENVQFIATDGFVANIPGALLARGEPWLAVEIPGAPWPPLKPGAASAGPFYLVWIAPEKSGVTPEQWPYRVARISALAPLERRFPQILPSGELAADSAERRGLKVYVESCAVCHPLNGGGDAKIGPDLNRPLNPTEYFHDAYLRKLIRDPAAVRNWPQRAMPAFPPSSLSESRLNDLIAYLRHMAKSR